MTTYTYLVRPDYAPAVASGCEGNADCPDHTACQNRKCINPCAPTNPCIRPARCEVIYHEVACACPNGFIGDITTVCKPRKYILVHNTYVIKNMYPDLFLDIDA